MRSLIFSKNRPAQLELCLRSHKRFWGEDIKVLYSYDTEYKKGYDKLKKMYPEVEFELETDFRQQVIDSLGGRYTVYYCDDDVIIRPYIDITDRLNNLDIACISQRMGQNYDYCFDSDVPVEIPRFIDNLWEWQKYPLDWGYPMSVLGNIFRTEDIKPIIEMTPFRCPNTFEGNLAKNPIQKPLMVGFKEARNINLPQNLVQTISPKNRAGTLSIKEAYDRFMNGQIIDLDDVIEKTKDARSCFILVEFKWI